MTIEIGNSSTILSPWLIWKSLAIFYMSNNESIAEIHLCKTVLDNFRIDYPGHEDFRHEFVVDDIPIDDTSSSLVLIKSDSSVETIQIKCDATKIVEA